MVLPRNVLCVLGAWKSLAPVARLAREAGFELDDEHSQLEPDRRMMSAFEAAADRVKPSLLREDRAAIMGHRAVVYLLSPRLPVAEAQARSVQALALVQGLLDSGATAIKGESSGITHGAARWRQLAKRAVAAAATGDLLERASALYAAWVRRPIRDGAVLYSCGMHLLGEHDLELGPGEQLTDDLGWMDLLALYLLAEKPSRALVDGEGFRQRPEGERRILRLRACERYEPGDFAFNPYGYWQLERESRQAGE
jgi:hypothetical protein